MVKKDLVLGIRSQNMKNLQDYQSKATIRLHKGT